MKFCIGLESATGELIGVVVVGRPVARKLDDGFRCEVTRLCTDGSKNACSMLYAAARRASFAMGFTEIITYILDSESGASLKASGWELVGNAGGGTWSCKSRPRVDKHPITLKKLYKSTLRAA